MMRFSGKTAVVTGGASGIGREIVSHFAKEGARVISLDWDEAENRRAAAAICETGVRCEAVTADVSSSSDVQRAFAIAGTVDILVNNAAFSKGDGLLLDVSEEMWDRTVAISLKSVFLCSKAALGTMIERRAGVIINISSVNALSGIHLAAYTAAKGGVISLTRVLTAQYGRHGIRVNCICPGTILSESTRAYYEEHPEAAETAKRFYPGSQFGEPSDIASATVFLASDEASFINGATIVIDGGLSAIHFLTKDR